MIRRKDLGWCIITEDLMPLFPLLAKAFAVLYRKNNASPVGVEYPIKGIF
ncbi:hypothetical protein [Pedobacter sp. UBA5917]|jgi:hypothetical protein|nr:hypothetical protein [Pedobacter sp. UBA5917]